MLEPKRSKHRKMQKGRRRGRSKGATKLDFGEYGLRALESGWLTARQIEEGVAGGKIDSGGRPLAQEVNEEQAVGAALQAFEDRLYLVVLDGQEQRELDRQVFLRPDSRLTFVRLVMLAGGL